MFFGHSKEDTKKPKIATIALDFSFSAAHRLQQHLGKCKRLHGHNYTVSVDVTGVISPLTGMVLDFDVLKHIINKVDKKYDHRTLLEKADPLIDILYQNGDDIIRDSIVTLDTPPTAENLAYLIKQMVTEQLSSLGFPPSKKLEVTNVTVWETDKASASTL